MKRISAAAVWALPVALSYGAGLWMNPTAGEVKEIRGGSARFRPGAATAFPGTGLTSIQSRLQRALARLPRESVAEWMRCLDSATTADLQAAAEWLDSQERPRNEECRLLWTRWGELDGPAAIAACSRSRNQKFFLSSVLSGWAGSDPLAAMAWVRKQDAQPFDLHSASVRGTLDGWAQRDLPGVTAFLFAPGDGFDFKPADMAETITESVWNSRGADGVIAWMEALSHQAGCDDVFLKAVFSRTRGLMMQTADPAGAVAFLRGSVGKPWCEADDVERILRGTCDGDPAKILEASADLGPDPVTGRHYLLDYALTRWNATDPKGAAAWLESRAGSSVYDPAAAACAEALASTDRVAALRWAQSIQSEELRSGTLRQMATIPDVRP